MSQPLGDTNAEKENDVLIGQKIVLTN